LITRAVFGRAPQARAYAGIPKRKQKASKIADDILAALQEFSSSIPRWLSTVDWVLEDLLEGGFIKKLRAAVGQTPAILPSLHIDLTEARQWALAGHRVKAKKAFDRAEQRAASAAYGDEALVAVMRERLRAGDIEGATRTARRTTYPYQQVEALIE